MSISSWELAKAEIAKYDWASLNGCRSNASKVPSHLERFLTSTTESSHACSCIEDIVCISGGNYESAIPVVSVLLAALAGGTCSRGLQSSIVELLFQILNGCTHTEERKRGVSTIDRCHQAAQKGYWLLVSLKADVCLIEQVEELLDVMQRFDSSQTRKE